MKKIVIFRTNSRFNMVTPKQWEKNAHKLGETVAATARTKSISEATFRQFAHLTHRKEVQTYLKEVWLS
jgi:hypothetical protein